MTLHFSLLPMEKSSFDNPTQKEMNNDPEVEQNIKRIRTTKNDGSDLSFLVMISRQSFLYQQEVVNRSEKEPIVIPVEWLAPYLLLAMEQQAKTRSFFLKSFVDLTNSKKCQKRAIKNLLLIQKQTKTELTGIESQLTPKKGIFSFLKILSSDQKTQLSTRKGQLEAELRENETKRRERELSLKTIKSSILLTDQRLDQLGQTNPDDELNFKPFLAKLLMQTPIEINGYREETVLKWLGEIKFKIELDFSKIKELDEENFATLVSHISLIFPETGEQIITRLRVPKNITKDIPEEQLKELRLVTTE